MWLLALKVVITMNKKPISKILLVFVSLISLVIGFIGGALVSLYLDRPISDTLGELEIHFLELGNDSSGDSILIQVGDYDILVDAGSKKSSYNTIKTYLDKELEDYTLEYVIVTHAHEDHYANFAGDGETSLLTDYNVTNLIQFARTNQTTGVMYNNYLNVVEKIENEGTNVYTALECYNNENGCNRNIDLGNDTELEILYNYYYENRSNEENNYSVCFMINQNDNHFLFTGDLEEEGEEKLVEYNSLPKVTLYKAGHHGSNTSSHDVLLDVIQPEIVVVTCVAGNFEYATNKPGNVNIDGTFPTTNTLKRIAKHTSKVYVTSLGLTSQNPDGTFNDIGHESMNGDIIVTSNLLGVEVIGSNNNILLKDTDWAKTYRSSVTWTK